LTRSSANSNQAHLPDFFC